MTSFQTGRRLKRDTVSANGGRGSMELGRQPEGGFSGAVRVDREDEDRATRGPTGSRSARTRFRTRSTPVRDRERREGLDRAHRREPDRGRHARALDDGALCARGRSAADRRRRDGRAPAFAPIGHRRLPRRGRRSTDINDYLMPVPVHELATTEHFLAVLDGHPQVRARERFAYCNGGFVVLALIAERTSGEPFHDLVRQRVCEPAGMRRHRFLRSDELPGRAALGYLTDRRRRGRTSSTSRRGSGDGGIYSTVADISRSGRRSSRAGSCPRSGWPSWCDLAAMCPRPEALRPRLLAPRVERRRDAGRLRRGCLVSQRARPDDEHHAHGDLEHVRRSVADRAAHGRTAVDLGSAGGPQLERERERSRRARGRRRRGGHGIRSR